MVFDPEHPLSLKIVWDPTNTYHEDQDTKEECEISVELWTRIYGRVPAEMSLVAKIQGPRPGSPRPCNSENRRDWYPFLTVDFHDEATDEYLCTRPIYVHPGGELLENQCISLPSVIAYEESLKIPHNITEEITLIPTLINNLPRSQIPRNLIKIFIDSARKKRELRLKKRMDTLPFSHVADGTLDDVYERPHDFEGKEHPDRHRHEHGHGHGHPHPHGAAAGEKVTLVGSDEKAGLVGSIAEKLMGAAEAVGVPVPEGAKKACCGGCDGPDAQAGTSGGPAPPS